MFNIRISSFKFVVSALCKCICVCLSLCGLFILKSHYISTCELCMYMHTHIHISVVWKYMSKRACKNVKLLQILPRYQ